MESAFKEIPKDDYTELTYHLNAIVEQYCQTFNFFEEEEQILSAKKSIVTIVEDDDEVRTTREYLIITTVNDELFCNYVSIISVVNTYGETNTEVEYSTFDFDVVKQIKNINIKTLKTLYGESRQNE